MIDGNQKEFENYKIFEVSWGAESDSSTYADGHIPGAIHFDTEQVECEPYWNLCDADVLEKALLGMGIIKDTTAIFYGDPNGEVARVAYACVYAGVENVKVVNGGIDAWKNAGYDMEKDSNEAKMSGLEKQVDIHILTEQENQKVLFGDTAEVIHTTWKIT